MSVLCKDYDRPECCNLCDFRDSYSCWFTDSVIYDQYEKRNEDCPLIPVPKPHGRLVDADFILGRLRERLPTKSGTARCQLDFAIALLEKAPTVIEAEE